MVEILSDEVSRLVQGLGLQDDHVVALLQQVARPTDVDGSFLGKYKLIQVSVCLPLAGGSEFQCGPEGLGSNPILFSDWLFRQNYFIPSV